MKILRYGKDSLLKLLKLKKKKNVIIGKKNNGRNGSFFTWLAAS